VDSALRRGNGVGVDQPEGVVLGAKNRFLGGDVEGHDIDPLREP